MNNLFFSNKDKNCGGLGLQKKNRFKQKLLPFLSPKFHDWKEKVLTEIHFPLLNLYCEKAVGFEK